MRASLVLLVAMGSLAACGSSGREPLAGAGTSRDGGEGSGGPSSFADVDGGANAGADAGACPNIDILFVVDNSGSMADKQARLASSFPGFAAAIQKRLSAARSVHVGVVSTSAYYAGAPQECLVTKTEGPESSNATCITGAPYLTGAEGDFAQRFACVAKVGAGGDDDEKPMKAALGALSPARNAPGGCNAGFSRSDALLVLVLITDEDDVRESDCDPFTFQGTCGTDGDPDSWASQIVSFKGGHAENVVVLSLVSRKAGTCSNTVGVNVTSFTHRFGARGFLGDVCDASYEQFFDAALPVLEGACATFVAPK